MHFPPTHPTIPPKLPPLSAHPATMIPFPELEKIVEPVAPGSAAGTGPAWWWWLLAALVATLALITVFTLLRKLIRHFRFPSTPPDPAREAIRQLETLQRNSSATTETDTAATVSTIVRHYLDRLAGIMARYSTTEEIMGHSRKPAPPPTPAISACEAILASCDQIRFGNTSIPPATLVSNALTAIRASQAAPAPAAPHTSQQPPPLPHAPAA
ncbi:MAG: hypothetical protein RLZZ179_1139 [Verrucomicrobiota bacterium]